MGLRRLHNAIDGTLNRWWCRMSPGVQLAVALVVAVAWVFVLVGVAIATFVGYMHYLIRTGQFID